jgi:N-acetyl-anhydromuramyl-L-alanine amidase AmpD
MDRQILARTAQANAGLRLVRYLQARFDIKTKNVVGHATANASPYFKEFAGIKNAAGDWFATEVKAFCERL